MGLCQMALAQTPGVELWARENILQQLPRFLSLSARPLSENRRAYAKHRRAFFNRDLVIVRHAHRKLAEAIAERALFANLIAHFTQPAEEWSRFFRFVKERRQSHQANQRKTF